VSDEYSGCKCQLASMTCVRTNAVTFAVHLECKITLGSRHWRSVQAELRGSVTVVVDIITASKNNAAQIINNE